MNYNSVTYPVPNKELKDYIIGLSSEGPLKKTLNKLLTIRSKKELEAIRGNVTKIILREKGSTLGNEIQRVFRCYSSIYSKY